MKTKEEILQALLISKFVGMNYDPTKERAFIDGEWRHREVYFQSSWDWLMLAVEKINKMHHRITIEGNEEENKCMILCYNEDGELSHEVYECGLNLLEATLKAVIEFIEW